AAAGARWAGFTFVPLRGPVQAAFVAPLRDALPRRAAHVLARTRDARAGALGEARFGHRMRGEGPYAEAARALVGAAARTAGRARARAQPRGASGCRRRGAVRPSRARRGALRGGASGAARRRRRQGRPRRHVGRSADRDDLPTACARPQATLFAVIAVSRTTP